MNNQIINDTIVYNKIEDIKDICLYTIRKINSKVLQKLFIKSQDEINYTDISNFFEQDITKFQDQVEWLLNIIYHESNKLN